MKGINIAEYIYGNYTKGEFPRFEVEMALAQRAEAAILARDLKRLFEKPLEVYHYSGKFCYEPEKLEGHFWHGGGGRAQKPRPQPLSRGVWANHAPGCAHPPPRPGVGARHPAVHGPLLWQEVRLKTHPAVCSKAKLWGLLSGRVQWEGLLRVTSCLE